VHGAPPAEGREAGEAKGINRGSGQVERRATRLLISITIRSMMRSSGGFRYRVLIILRGRV
jgi:hypothetical protein